MSTHTLPGPARLRDQLRYLVDDAGYVQVTPRDKDGRRCAAWDAEWYEVAAFYMYTGTPLDPLEEKLRALPGVCRTTQVQAEGQARDPDWPGFARRYNPGYNPLRPQVLALIADP